MAQPMLDLPYTRHALARCARRGVALHVASLLLDHADLTLHAGAGCVSVRLGRDAAAGLVHEGARPEEVDRARRLVALIGDRGVVTVIRPEGRAGRRYRRQLATRAQRTA